MRKIEREMLRAINTPGEDWTSSNTAVRWSLNKSFCEVRLHGHIIASINWMTCKMSISDCTWQTPTTKSRLNALLDCLGEDNEHITQKKGIWILSSDSDSVEMDSGSCYLIRI